MPAMSDHVGGDDVAAVRAQPTMFGPVASDPTVSRLFAALAIEVDEAVAAIRGAPAQARAAVWARHRPLAGAPGRRAGGRVIVDLDATLVTAHSDKEGAEPTFKRGYGFAPMCAFVDHGADGIGETLAVDATGPNRHALASGGLDEDRSRSSVQPDSGLDTACLWCSLRACGYSAPFGPLLAV